jgi:hypothetical protein
VRRIVRVIGLGVLGAVLVAAPVSAGQPEMERILVDEVFVDTFLSAECGVEVNAHIYGHIIFRTFTDADGNPVREVNNYANTVQWSSVNGTIHAKDVGADRATYLDDGGLIVIIIGSVQSFSSPGRGRVYADTGRTMLEFDADGNLVSATPLGGQHDADQLEAICSVLGG